MVAVLSKSGIRLMPTSNYKARRLLKSKRAKIYQYRPFTIQLTDREDGNVQPVELKCDTGYLHVGVSIVSQKHEYVRAQFDLLKDETERHNDCRKYRRQRRNRLRYRRARFDNRKSTKPEGWLAPSIRHKMEAHIEIFRMYEAVIPISLAFLEMGQFDTQVLKAIEEGKELPVGVDYQRGERYMIATLREAVFTRDDHSCICCKRSVKDGAILHVHHLGYRFGDRSNRLSNLGTVCEKCHTPANHKEGGRIYDLKPKLRHFKGATFMTMVRWQLLGQLKKQFPDVEFHVTYGAATKEARHCLHILKSHSNDAYAMGHFHPKHRAKEEIWEKRRRNNRILEKFYDAKYIDSRDGKKKTGQQLFCGRSKRNQNTNTENLHRYRSKKVSKGRRSIRRNHYSLRPGDTILFQNFKYKVAGVQNHGDYVKLKDGKVVPVKKVTCLNHCNGWAILG